MEWQGFLADFLFKKCPIKKGKTWGGRERDTWPRILDLANRSRRRVFAKTAGKSANSQIGIFTALLSLLRCCLVGLDFKRRRRAFKNKSWEKGGGGEREGKLALTENKGNLRLCHSISHTDASIDKTDEKYCFLPKKGSKLSGKRLLFAYR